MEQVYSYNHEARTGHTLYNTTLTNEISCKLCALPFQGLDQPMSKGLPLEHLGLLDRFTIRETVGNEPQVTG